MIGTGLASRENQGRVAVLVSDSALARKLGINRHTVTNSIARLAACGLVVVRTTGPGEERGRSAPRCFRDTDGCCAGARLCLLTQTTVRAFAIPGTSETGEAVTTSGSREDVSNVPRSPADRAPAATAPTNDGTPAADVSARGGTPTATAGADRGTSDATAAPHRGGTAASDGGESADRYRHEQTLKEEEEKREHGIQIQEHTDPDRQPSRGGAPAASSASGPSTAASGASTGDTRGREPRQGPDGDDECSGLLDAAMTAYREEIGPITARVRKRLRGLTRLFPEWGTWDRAFEAAASANVRRLNYLEAVLHDRGPGPGRGRRPAPTSRPRKPQASSGATRRGRASRNPPTRRPVVQAGDMPEIPPEEPLPPPSRERRPHCATFCARPISSASHGLQHPQSARPRRSPCTSPLQRQRRSRTLAQTFQTARPVADSGG